MANRFAVLLLTHNFYEVWFWEFDVTSRKHLRVDDYHYSPNLSAMGKYWDCNENFKVDHF